LQELCLSADVLVAAMGKARFVKASMVKKGAVVVDVGINRVDGKIIGDVDFDEVAPKCSHITPVPGGVGPMTIAMLLSNTLLSYQRKQ
jgi:methylenetetrahydrofolate dehydrogenase (NADP+)/methenyltetrahydrofolate cyclohydrolase